MYTKEKTGEERREKATFEEKKMLKLVLRYRGTHFSQFNPECVNRVTRASVIAPRQLAIVLEWGSTHTSKH